MSGKWTKGPWQVGTANAADDSHLDIGIRFCDEYGSGFVLADMCTDTDEDQEANANLMAAAPEMYEALEHALGWAEAQLYALPPTDDPGVSAKKDRLSSDIGRYRSALKKARGEQ